MLQAIIGALCGVGLFFVLADVYRIPYLKTSKAVESLSKQQKEKTSALNIWLGNLAEFLARHMKLNEFKKAQLEADLKTAQMDITPEKFKANAIIGTIAAEDLPEWAKPGYDKAVTAQKKAERNER